MSTYDIIRTVKGGNHHSDDRNGGHKMIKEVYVSGKEVHVRYDSERWACYMKKEDLPWGMKGVKPLPKTVVNFMRENPNKVR